MCQKGNGNTAFWEVLDLNTITHKQSYCPQTTPTKGHCRINSRLAHSGVTNKNPSVLVSPSNSPCLLCLLPHPVPIHAAL